MNEANKARWLVWRWQGQQQLQGVSAQPAHAACAKHASREETGVRHSDECSRDLSAARARAGRSSTDRPPRGQGCGGAASRTEGRGASWASGQHSHAPGRVCTSNAPPERRSAAAVACCAGSCWAADINLQPVNQLGLRQAARDGQGIRVALARGLLALPGGHLGRCFSWRQNGKVKQIRLGCQCERV
jgi:hypothetical protein